jgi:NADH-quinone oxidoreductase subunit L
LSGFFSKDEILFRTFTAHTPGHLLFYGIAIVTSLLTATYMFRLVFLTFHGERRHDAPAFASGSGGAGPAQEHPEEEERAAANAHGAPAHAAHAPAHAVATHAPAAAAHAGHGHGHGGGHGHEPHEAPWSMAIPLILLAVGSIVAGYVGVPHALGGSNRIESFLEPSFEAHAAAGQETAAPAAAETHEPEAAHADIGTERTLMALSVGIALAGIGLAWYFWLANRKVVEGLARSFAPLHRLLLNKYYVDELYDAAIVQPIKKMSTGALWKGVDAGLIDGTVNGVGLAVSGASTGLRRLQTGSVRTYAFALFAGAISILAYYLFS